MHILSGMFLSKLYPQKRTHEIIIDLTEAAGWQLLDCDPNWSDGAHNVRMVCTGTPEQIAHCQHVYEHRGAENTVVRLPDNVCIQFRFLRLVI